MDDEFANNLVLGGVLALLAALVTFLLDVFLGHLSLAWLTLGLLAVGLPALGVGLMMQRR